MGLFTRRQEIQPDGLILQDESTEQEEETYCAWCIPEDDLARLTGSHSICSKHAEQILAEAEERRAQRGR